METVLYADSTQINLEYCTVFDSRNLFPINRSKIPPGRKIPVFEESIVPQDDLYTITGETKFGDQFETRGNETIPTNLLNGEQLDTPNDEPSDADENEVDYITTRDGLNDANDAAQSRSEGLIDDVNKRNETIEYVRNDNSDWPDSAVYPANQCQTCPKDRKMMPIIRKKLLLMKTMHIIIQTRGMILCPKYRKMRIERKIRALEVGSITSNLTPTQTTQKTSDTRKK